MKSYALPALLFLVLSACKGPADKKTPIADTLPLAAAWQLPDSVRIPLDNYFLYLANENKCRITVKITNPSGESYYTGFDGRDSTPITDFSGTVDIGSCSKMFTATSVLQLIEQNKLSLSDRLVSVLPNDSLYKNLLVIDGKDYIDSVTILNLLNHSSGFPEYFIEGDDDKEFALHGDSTLRFTPYELIGMAKKTNKPAFKPGTQFKYCNVNYILLGLIIEKLSGQPWQQYVQEHILDPLGLKHTYFASLNSPAGRAPGHYKGKESQMPATLAGAAGEIISTLDDMQSFIRQWSQGKLFSNPETIESLKKDDFLDMGNSIQYGMGVINLMGLSFGHAGQTFGFQAYMGSLPNGCSFALSIDDAAVAAWGPAMYLSNYLKQLY